MQPPLEQGIHDDIPMDAYIADPCVQPSVSTGVIVDIIQRSPKHAARRHPRLGGVVTASTPKMDMGSACHELLCGGDREIVPVDAANYRTDAAKAVRDKARADGNVPILSGQVEAMEKMWSKAQAALCSILDIQDYGDALYENTLLWQDEGGVWCRSRPDILTAGATVSIDYKTTGNAAPESWVKKVLFKRADAQAGLVLRGLRAIEGITGEHYWLVQETEAPYECSVVEMTPELEEYADKMCAAAIRVWGRHVESKKFPAYSSKPFRVEVPAWRTFELETRLARLGV